VPTECNATLFECAPIDGCRVVAAVRWRSDHLGCGCIAAGETDRAIRLTERFAGASSTRGCRHWWSMRSARGSPVAAQCRELDISYTSTSTSFGRSDRALDNPRRRTRVGHADPLDAGRDDRGGSGSRRVCAPCAVVRPYQLRPGCTMTASGRCLPAWRGNAERASGYFLGSGGGSSYSRTSCNV
jgi:hypothetical protein